MTPVDGGPVAHPTMTHLLHLDKADPIKVKHWYGAVGPVQTAGDKTRIVVYSSHNSALAADEQKPKYSASITRRTSPLMAVTGVRSRRRHSHLALWQ